MRLPPLVLVAILVLPTGVICALIYTSKLAGLPIHVATTPGGKIWEINNGTMKDTGKKVGEKQ
jgi:hypothetical protein